MADKTTSSIVIEVPREDVMTVIADFAAYPEWAAAVRSAEVLSQDPGGRASAGRFRLDAGVIKDSYVLGYDWDGDARVRWNLSEAGSVISEMTGGGTPPRRSRTAGGSLRPARLRRGTPS